MAATAPVGHRCRVRPDDLVAEIHRCHRLEVLPEVDPEELAGRLDRLRANIERSASEMDWLSPETKELLRTKMAEVRREIATIRRRSR